jgi:hypothetical protein
VSYTAAPAFDYAAGIATLGNHSCLPNFAYQAAASSTAWPSANLAIYVPVRVPRPCIVKKLALANGAGVAGNFDIGIYTSAGSRLVSTGSTAQTGVSTEQVVATTDTLLSVGLYYLATCLSSVSGFVMAIPLTAPLVAAHGVLTEALGSVTLPATATWAVDHTVGIVPLMMAFLDPTVT